MKLLYKTIYRLKIGDMYAELKVETNGCKLYVTLTPIFFQENLYNEAEEIPASIEYNGEIKDITAPSDSTRRVSFPYDDGVRAVSLIADSVTYTGKYDSSTCTFSWAGSYNDPDPQAEVSPGGVRAGEYFTAGFSFAEAAGYNMHLIELRYSDWRSEVDRWRTSVPIWKKQTTAECSVKINSVLAEGTLVRFDMLFACYKSVDGGMISGTISGDATSGTTDGGMISGNISGDLSSDMIDDTEEYVGLYHYISPAMPISAAGKPYAPIDLKYNRPRRSESEQVQWSLIYDGAFPTVEYELEKATDGYKYFEQIYAGSKTEYTDTIDSWTKSVKYRVRSVKSGKYSPWITGEFKSVNSGENVYVGIDGEAIQADGVYMEIDGEVVKCTVSQVGRGETDSDV